ncbi:unnamed protein product, partial [Rotaria sp. Silwood2]
MPYKCQIWCAHPCHDEVLPNGKKRFWKTGLKPSHLKGKRSINEELADFINNHNEAVLNGSSKRLSKGDYFCSWCFTKEANPSMIDEEKHMDFDHSQESPNYNSPESGSNNQQDSPMDDDYIRAEEEDTKMKNQISNAVDEAYFELREWSNTLLPSSHRNEEPEMLSSLNLSIDDAAWILYRLRELYTISNNEEKQRIMTMLPPIWGRDRIANWLDGSEHHARQSIQLRSTTGVLSNSEDRRGNKPLDSQIELAVYNFYTSDEISRETSYKKQGIHSSPLRTPIPIRFLHLTIGKTFEQFKMKYPNMELSRSKFFSLRPQW